MAAYAQKECVVCSAVKPANEMVKIKEKVRRSQSGWGLNFGKLWSGKRESAIGLIRAPRNNYAFETHWYCEDCWAQQQKAERNAVIGKVMAVGVLVLILIIGMYLP